MSCESIDLLEGHACMPWQSAAPQVDAAFAENLCSGIHVKAKDMCLVVAGAPLLVGLETLGAPRGTWPVWWPAPR
eukprot:2730247-Lingulodinium_polyedra.AAC.1